MFGFITRYGGDCVVPIKEFPVGATPVVRGTPVVLANGVIGAGAANSTAFVGVANGTDGDNVEVILGLEDVVFIADYIGSTKTTLAAADVGSAFGLDITGKNIDLDNPETTGATSFDAPWVVVGYDNNNAKALVKLKAAARQAVI